MLCWDIYSQAHGISSLVMMMIWRLMKNQFTNSFSVLIPTLFRIVSSDKDLPTDGFNFMIDVIFSHKCSCTV